MDYNLILPVVLILGIVYAIKSVVDGHTRRRIVEARGSEELVRSLLAGDTTKRRIDRVTPGAIALLLGATGLGNVVYFVLDRRLK